MTMALATRRALFWAAVAALLTTLGAAATADEAAHDDLPPADEVTPELYATGFEFAEGPALDAQGNLYVVNYRANGNIGVIEPDGTARIFCDLREAAPVADREPRANGLKIDSEGRLVAADSGAGRLLRIAADGSSVEVLADRCEGERFNAVNDVALDKHGNIYFSDPGGSSRENPVGSIYRFNIKTAKVSRLDTGLAFPNGIGVAPDHQWLCLSESAKKRTLIYRLADDGSLADRKVLIQYPEEKLPEGGEYIPDGFVFDAEGRLYVGMWTAGVINVVDVPSGRLLRQYDAGGARATNCHFHDGYLYTTVAAKEAVFRLELNVPGYDYNGTGGPR